MQSQQYSRPDLHSPAPTLVRMQPQTQYHSQAFSTSAPTNMKQEQVQVPPPPKATQSKEEHIEQPAGEPIPATQPKTQTSAPASRRQSTVQSPLSLAPEHKTPFYPALPWYSVPEATFPRRDMARRRRTQKLHKTTDTVALPAAPNAPQQEAEAPSKEPSSEASTIAAPSESETPATSQAPSESDYTQVSTPATPAQPSTDSPKITPTQTHVRRDTRTAIAIPNIPGLPKRASPPAVPKQDAAPDASTEQTTPTPETQPAAQTEEHQAPAQEQEGPKTPPPKAAPKSWADLVRTKGANGAASQANGAIITNGATIPKSATLSDALRQYSVDHGATLSFLEPRGLVNTGNMCYMNSVNTVIDMK